MNSNTHRVTTETVRGGKRLVEIVRNGEVVARAAVPADGEIHELEFTLPVDQSSWIALRDLMREQAQAFEGQQGFDGGDFFHRFAE